MDSSEPVRPTLEQLQRYAEGFNKSRTLGLFGVKISFPTDDRARAVLDPVLPAHRGGLGTEAVNGGVLAAMFDLALGITGALVSPEQRNATVQLSMSFQKAVMGNRIWADAFIQQRTSTMLFSAAELYDEQGVICARATGIVRLLRGSWNNREHPGIN